MFESADKLILGLLTGIIFGFLLQKGQVAKYQVIMAQFLFKDWTVVKIMGTAVAVGSIGVYGMKELGWVHLEVKPAAPGGLLLGGTLFGLGLAVFGLCPGTSVAACGEGQRDAMVGVLGMLAGAGAYVALFQPLQTVINGLGDWGKVTLPEISKISPWPWLAGLALGVAVLFALLERNRREPRLGVPE